MARIRTIKPTYWTSEQVMELSIPARLIFIGMWNFCDDFGVHPASIKTLKAEVLPADDVTVQEVLGMVKELIENGLLVEFEKNSRRWWFVTGWEHQLINRPSATRYPEPPRLAPLPSAAGVDDGDFDAPPCSPADEEGRPGILDNTQGNTGEIPSDKHCNKTKNSSIEEGRTAMFISTQGVAEQPFLEHAPDREGSLSPHGGLTEPSLSPHGGLTVGKEGKVKDKEGIKEKDPPPMASAISCGDDPSLPSQSAVKASHRAKSSNTLGVKDLTDLGVSSQIAQDWVSLRNQKRASITKTVIDGVVREANKVGITLEQALQICCERNWQGFNAEWLDSSPNRGNGNHRAGSITSSAQAKADARQQSNNALREKYRSKIIEGNCHVEK